VTDLLAFWTSLAEPDPSLVAWKACPGGVALHDASRGNLPVPTEKEFLFHHTNTDLGRQPGRWVPGISGRFQDGKGEHSKALRLRSGTIGGLAPQVPVPQRSLCPPALAERSRSANDWSTRILIDKAPTPVALGLVSNSKALRLRSGTTGDWVRRCLPPCVQVPVPLRSGA
jgi:hypothetical protein